MARLGQTHQPGWVTESGTIEWGEHFDSAGADDLQEASSRERTMREDNLQEDYPFVTHEHTCVFTRNVHKITHIIAHIKSHT